MSNKLTHHNGTWFLTNPNDIYIGKSVEVYGEWSHREVESLKLFLKPDSNVVEAGSNIGAHTVFLARDICPNGLVFAFEPRRLCFQMLCANLALNSIGNVHAFQTALGREISTITEGPLPSGVANLGGFALGSLEGGEERIDVERLDDRLNGLPRIALIKVDVEGWELDVVTGATGLIERDRPILYLENDRVDRSEALLRAVIGLGYRIYWHIVPIYRADNFAGTRVNIFGNVSSFNILCLPVEHPLTVNGLPLVTDPAVHPLAAAKAG